MKKVILLLAVVGCTLSISAQMAGTLDTTFNHTGILVEPASIVGDNVFIDIQQDGKLVVAGSTKFGAQVKFFVMRFNPDGTKDSSFGDAGAVVSNFGDDDHIVKDLLIHDNGKIVVAGHFTPANRGFIIRINPDGTIDRDFGIDGIGYVDLEEFATEFLTNIDVQTDSDGNWGYVVSGHYKPTGDDTKYTKFIARILASGSNIHSYLEANGITKLNMYGSDNYNTDLLVLEDNNILISGWLDNESNTTRYFDVSKLLADGTIDLSFGNDTRFDGYSSFNFNNGYALSVHGMSSLSSGKLLFFGEYRKSGETSSQNDIFVLRTTSDGELDWAYGGENHSYKHFEFTPGGNDKAYAVKEIARGKTIVAGTGGNMDAALVCLDSMGQPDPEFGTNGELVFEVQGEEDIILSAAVNNDGSKLYVAGRSYNSIESQSDLFIASIDAITENTGPTAIPINPGVDSKQAELTIWPNPVQNSEQLTLRFKSIPREVVHVEIYNASGQLTGHQLLDPASLSVSIPVNQHPGLYIVKVRWSNQNLNQLLLVL